MGGRLAKRLPISFDHLATPGHPCSRQLYGYKLDFRQGYGLTAAGSRIYYLLKQRTYTNPGGNIMV